MDDEQKESLKSNLQITDYPSFMSGKVKVDQLDDLKDAALLIFFALVGFAGLVLLVGWLVWRMI